MDPRAKITFFSFEKFKKNSAFFIINFGVEVKMLSIGIITAAAALVFELIILILFPYSSEIILSKISLMVIFGILIEEIFKLAAIWKISETIQNKNKLILSSFFIGAGFFLAEFILSLYQSPINLIYYIGPFLVHVSTAVIFGYCFARFQKTKVASIFALAIAIVLHFAFNAIIIYRN